jgi:thiol:disulfide interchange protein DsbD
MKMPIAKPDARARRALLLPLLLIPALAIAGDDPLAALRGLVGGGGQKEFLKPDRAFVFNAEDIDGKTIRAQWDVADGYYLYRSKFDFKIETPGVSLGTVDVPHGQFKDDENFGKVEIMHGSFAVNLPLQFAADTPAPTKVNLTVAYQGCAEDGICYPPIHKSVAVALAQNSGASAAPTDPASTTGKGTGSVNETDRIAGVLGDGFSLRTLAIFFGYGLLLALTPCVFPMVPILSGILVGQKQTTAVRAFVLSAVYVLAMALTYAAAGVIAGLFGKNLQAAFQQPAVLVAFALIFVALALSMFGFYELQLPAAWQSRLDDISRHQRVGSLGGVALMGVLSAVIVGPCVAAPLAGALVYIGRSGNALLGGTALFTMALGMGAPLLAVGASAGHLLPRAGAWMESVKKIFGVLMLAMAVWFVSRILPPSVTLGLYALIAIIAASMLGAFHSLDANSSGAQRLGKGFGLAAGVYALALFVGALSGRDDPLQPLAGLFTPRATMASNLPARLIFAPVRGADGLKAALAAAGGKPVLLDFYADWCIECKKLEKETFADDSVRNTLRDVVLLRADVTANDDSDQTLLHQLDLIGPPAILFFDHDGAEKRSYRLQGFIEPLPFVQHVKSANGLCKPQGQMVC